MTHAGSLHPDESFGQHAKTEKDKPLTPYHFKETRSKLLKFLKESSSYDIAQLLICAENTSLHEERVILNSKNRSHSKALHILIYEYKVFFCKKLRWHSRIVLST